MVDYVDPTSNDGCPSKKRETWILINRVQRVLMALMSASHKTGTGHMPRRWDDSLWGLTQRWKRKKGSTQREWGTSSSEGEKRHEVFINVLAGGVLFCFVCLFLLPVVWLFCQLDTS